jgi:hypothetical protein
VVRGLAVLEGDSIRTLAPDEVRLHFTEHMERVSDACRVCSAERARHRFLARIDAQRIVEAAHDEERIEESRNLLRTLAGHHE